MTLPAMIPAIDPLLRPDFEIGTGTLGERVPEGLDSSELVEVDASECGCSPSEVALDGLDDLVVVATAFEPESAQDEDETPVPFVAV